MSNKTTNKLNQEYVLKKISEARVKEELAIPIYSSHIKQTLFWSGLPENKREKIIASLIILESDSMRHSKILKIVYDNYLNSQK